MKLFLVVIALVIIILILVVMIIITIIVVIIVFVASIIIDVVEIRFHNMFFDTNTYFNVNHCFLLAWKKSNLN